MTARQLASQLLIATIFVAFNALAQEPNYEPEYGQPGKDVVWVPTPDITLEKMMDMANVTSSDFVVDLGSGDGRNVIAAAKRGARALGVEYNPDLVALARHNALAQGVADRAEFVHGDMFTADISRATAMALFLLPENLQRLGPRFLDLRPGTRIVSNTFAIAGWEALRTDTAEGDCGEWCEILLYIVPAKVAGTWRMAQGELNLEQKAQVLTGTLTSGGVSRRIESGRMNGEEIAFFVDGSEYFGRHKDGTLSGSIQGKVSGNWTATRAHP